VDTGTTSGYVLNESIEYLLAETNYEQEMINAIQFRKIVQKGKMDKNTKSV